MVRWETKEKQRAGELGLGLRVDTSGQVPLAPRAMEIICSEILCTLNLDSFVKHLELKTINVVNHHQLGLMNYVLGSEVQAQDLVTCTSLNTTYTGINMKTFPNDWKYIDKALLDCT